MMQDFLVNDIHISAIRYESLWSMNDDKMLILPRYQVLVSIT